MFNHLSAGIDGINLNATPNVGNPNAFGSNNMNLFQDTGMGPSSKGGAVLYVFSRKFIPDQYRRPHLYQFGGEFRMDLQNNIERSVKDPKYDFLDTFMMDSVKAKSAILPSAVGQHVNMKIFTEMWTFVLVVDNDTGLSPIGIRTTIPSRMIYSGWVMDEPVTKANMSAHYTPNPGAIFTTTHHTTMTMQQIVGSTGMVQVPQTTGDYDYISATVAQNIQADANQLYNLSPDKVTSSIMVDPATTTGNTPPNIGPVPIVAGVNSDKKSIELPSEINSPAYHLRTIVGGLTDSVKFMNNNMDNGDIFGDKSLFNTANTLLNRGSSSAFCPLRPDTPFSFSELIDRYKQSLRVIVVNQPFDLSYDVGSAESVERRNVFSSIISSSIPPLLAQFNISDIAFRYASRVPKPIFTVNGDNSEFKVINAGQIYGNDPNTLTSSIQRFKQYLEMTIFPIIKANVGDFDLTLHCSIAGSSLVNLQILDEIKGYGLLETNNMLGGLNTPLLGNVNNLATNAGQICNVFRDVSAGTTLNQSNDLGGLPHVMNLTF